MRGEKQMNRKEKKAVGLLKALNNLEKKCKIEKVPYKSEIKKIMISLLPEDYGIFEILLNLIEKLQKENEELKNDYENLNNSVVVKNHCIKNSIPVQKVKDKIEEILNNGEYRIIFEGDTEIPDEATIINAQKYIKLEKLQELLEGRK
jgi:hypothetical protein